MRKNHANISMKEDDWKEVDRLKRDYHFSNESQVFQRALAACPSREFLQDAFKNDLSKDELRAWALNALQIMTGNIKVIIDEMED